MRYSAKRHYEWDDRIAYLVGLITADGCLSNDFRHLNITSKDIEIINIVQRILDRQFAIREKTGMYGSSAYYIQFSDVSLFDFLINIGLTPSKSLTIQHVTVPDCYYSDFLRGYFDGDGSTYGYWDTRWKHSWMFYTSFASGSRVFLEWLRASNTSLIGVSAGAIRKGTRAYQLSYAKDDSKKIFNAMYSTGDSLRLSRKYLKLIDFIEKDTYALPS